MPLDAQGAVTRDDVPLNAWRDLGLGRAFVRTLVMSIAEPNRFYALVTRDGSTYAALAYGLVFEMVVALLSFAYQTLVGAAETHRAIAGTPALKELSPRLPEALEEVSRWSATASLAAAPFGYLFELLTMAGMTWVGLRLIGDLRTSFAVLVRAFAYASWIRIFGALGATGDTIVSALAFLLTLGFASYYWLIAVRQTQQIATSRAVYASLLGGLVALVVGCVIGVPLLVVLILWVLSRIELPKITP